MTTYRSDVSNNTILSTNRLLSENDQLTAKYNQFKKNMMNSVLITNTNSTSSNQETEGNAYHINKQPDNDTDIKYTQLKRAYDERLNSLYNQIQIIANRILSDELVYNIKDREYLAERLKEIINVELIKEREEILRKISEENAEYKVKFATMSNHLDNMNKIRKLNKEYEQKINNLEEMLEQAKYDNETLNNELIATNTQLRNIEQGYDVDFKNLHEEYLIQLTKGVNDSQRLKIENESIKEQFPLYMHKLKEISEEYEENKLEMDRLQKVISVLEIDLNSTETKLKEKQARIEALQNENTELQTQNFEAILKMKKLNEENKSLTNLKENYERERKDILSKYTQFSNDMSKSQNEKFQIVEKEYKETISNLKAKIAELNVTIDRFEEEIEKEKNNSLNIKIGYSKLYTNIQEDMKMIKTEWEKRMIDQQRGFDKILSEVDNKHQIDIENLNHDHLNEKEKLNRDVLKFRQSADLLKNFEKEYISLNNHEEITSIKLEEMKKKLEKELKMNEEDSEREVRRRLFKLEEDKKSEFEFLTENMKKTIKSLEKINEEVKDEKLKLGNEVCILRESNENINMNLNNSQKLIKSLHNELEEKDSIINSLYEKNQEFEDNFDQISSTNKQLRLDLENYSIQVNQIRKEKENLSKELKESEENYHKDKMKLEKSFQLLKEKEEKKFDEENETKEKLKIQLNEYESEMTDVSYENNRLTRRINELENALMEFESQNETLIQKLHSYENLQNDLENQNLELTKKIKCFSFSQSSSIDMILNLLKTKITHLRNEISQIKMFYKNEMSNITNEHVKTVENLHNRLKLFTDIIEKEFEKKLIKEKEQLKISFESKETEIRNEMKLIEQKFEKHLLDQFRVNEKLEKEKKSLQDAQQNSVLKFKEFTYKIQEDENEMKKINNQVTKSKLENESLEKIIETLKHDKRNFERVKKELEEGKENYKREIVISLQNKISNILELMNKMKKKYSKEISNLKNELERLNKIHEDDKINSIKNSKILIENLNSELNELNNEKNSKDFQILGLQKNSEKSQDMFECKIQILNTKNEEIMKELKEAVKKKHEQIKDLTKIIHDKKSQFNMLKTQIELKNDEVINIKKEYENLFKSKDKKIMELQSVVNQSLFSYNSGLNNIKIANKLDDEVKVLMKRAKIDSSAVESKKK